METITKLFRTLKPSSFSVMNHLNSSRNHIRHFFLALRFQQFQSQYFVLGPGAEIWVSPQAQVNIGNNVIFLRNLRAFFEGHVSIGNNVFFSMNNVIAVHSRLSIGDNCLFGEHVSIHDADHRFGRGVEPVATRGFNSEPIVIGNNVWVGAKVTILKGVHIGDNAVIGANSVVTRNIPADSLAVGLPARVIRTF